LKAPHTSFQGLRLRGGFIIVRLEFVTRPLVDAIGRSALAKTQIVGREFQLTIVSSLSDKEKSVTLYHEVLEAMTVASSEAPASVQDFNEGDLSGRPTKPMSDTDLYRPKA